MLQYLGKIVNEKIKHIFYSIGYIGRVLISTFNFFKRGKASRKVFIMQLLFTYVDALPLIVMVGLALGSAIYVIGYPALVGMGQGNLVFTLLVIIITRELGPVLVAFVVTARSANAIATEIGGMVANHEIESYVSFGVDPFEHIVAPRFLGATVSVFFLNLYFSLAGLLIPVLITQFVNPVSFQEYFNSLLQLLNLKTIIVSCLKALLFGMVIAICSTYYGFSVERASTEVPVVGIKAVGKSLLWIIIADVIVTVMSYL